MTFDGTEVLNCKSLFTLRLGLCPKLMALKYGMDDITLVAKYVCYWLYLDDHFQILILDI